MPSDLQACDGAFSFCSRLCKTCGPWRMQDDGRIHESRSAQTHSLLAVFRGEASRDSRGVSGLMYFVVFRPSEAPDAMPVAHRVDSIAGREACKRAICNGGRYRSHLNPHETTPDPDHTPSPLITRFGPHHKIRSPRDSLTRQARMCICMCISCLVCMRPSLARSCLSNMRRSHVHPRTHCGTSLSRGTHVEYPCPYAVCSFSHRSHCTITRHIAA